MSNYRETNLAGSSWVRCKSLTITNPLVYDSVPSMANPYPGPTVYFHEEKVLSVGEEKFFTDAGVCIAAFDPLAIITVLDPNTGEPTGGTSTHAELYTILYSLYIQSALNRDSEVLLASQP